MRSIILSIALAAVASCQVYASPISSASVASAPSFAFKASASASNIYYSEDIVSSSAAAAAPTAPAYDNYVLKKRDLRDFLSGINHSAAAAASSLADAFDSNMDAFSSMMHESGENFASRREEFEHRVSSVRDTIEEHLSNIRDNIEENIISVIGEIGNFDLDPPSSNPARAVESASSAPPIAEEIIPIDDSLYAGNDEYWVNDQ